MVLDYSISNVMPTLNAHVDVMSIGRVNSLHVSKYKRKHEMTRVGIDNC